MCVCVFASWIQYAYIYFWLLAGLFPLMPAFVVVAAHLCSVEDGGRKDAAVKTPDW